MRTCDCPIVFPDNPAMSMQVHRYNCPLSLPQRLITDTLENLEMMRELWLYRIKAALLLASLTPHWPQYVAAWKCRAVAECLKVMSAEYLLSDQEGLLV